MNRLKLHYISKLKICADRVTLHSNLDHSVLSTQSKLTRPQDLSRRRTLFLVAPRLVSLSFILYFLGQQRTTLETSLLAPDLSCASLLFPWSIS